MSKTFTSFISLFAFSAMAIFSSQPAHADVYPWADEQITLAYQEKPLRTVLREFFASLGQPVVISERIQGSVTGKFDSTAESFFNDLKLVFGLISYYDGGIFYVNDSSEAVSRVIALKKVSPDRFRRALEEMGALDPEFTLRIQDDERIAQVSGPPRYVETIEEIAAKLNQTRVVSTVRRARPASPAKNRNTERFQPLEADFRVFELRHAWAQDTTMAVSGREIVIPGLATTLRNLLGNYTHGGRHKSGSATIGTSRRSLVERLRDSDSMTASGENIDAIRTGDAIQLVNTSLPRIEADARTNSIIVHDLPQRMERYETLIASLDQRSAMVQIEATIVDVSTDAVTSLVKEKPNLMINDGIDEETKEFFVASDSVQNGAL